jgi:membrane protease YdiL (CAAX protease family)
VSSRGSADAGVRRLAQWPKPTARSRQWTVRYAIGAYVAALVIMVVPGIALVLARVPLSFGGGALLFELAFLSTLAPLWRSGRLGIRDLGLRPVPGARSTGLVFLGLLAYGGFSIFWGSALHLPRTSSNFTGISHHSVGAIVLAGFVASVGAPVAEEVFFRGFLYRSLRNRLSILPACLLSATMFGLLHTQYPLAVRPVLVFFGVITCLLYERTGSLLPGIALHCIVDASGFESSLTGNDSIVASLFLLLALVLLARPPLRSLARRLRGGPAFRDFARDVDEVSPAVGNASSAGDDASAAAPRHSAGEEFPNPFALPDEARWRGGERGRLPVLLVVLALAIVALLQTRTRVFSTGSAHTSALASVRARGRAAEASCEDGADVSLADVDLGGILRLRGDVRGVIDSVRGRTYEWGTIRPQDMWSDGSPQRLAQASVAGEMWPASYEIRRFASDGDDIVADVLALATPAQAERFLARASSPRCHRDGEASPAPDPPQTHNLVWANPDGFTQEDAFLARGNLVYRVADVHTPPPGTPRATQEREALMTVNRLACSLAHAGCTPPAAGG